MEEYLEERGPFSNGTAALKGEVFLPFSEKHQISALQPRPTPITHRCAASWAVSGPGAPSAGTDVAGPA